MITYYIVAFIAGFLVKITDWIDDDRGGKDIIKYPFAIIYGIGIGYLISTAPFATIFIAALFAQIFARKIDSHTHMLGFFIAMISVLFMGFPQIEILYFVIFLILAFLDEIEFVGRLKWISDHRPFLKLGALPFILIGKWEFFAGIVTFDLGYHFFDWIQHSYIRKK